MSTRRWRASDELRRDAQGRPLCRWCGGVVKPPRRTFCDDACVHEHSLRTSSTYLRAIVFERDAGRCAGCGINAHRLREAFYRVPYRDREWWRVALRLTPAEAEKSWWQADHRLPVHAGGGECGLHNVQTLCTWCHRTKTRAERQRRAGRENEGPRGDEATWQGDYGPGGAPAGQAQRAAP